jgi:phage shock protein A
MTLRSRLALFFNVKTSAALDQIEDPREVLDYAYGVQRVQLHTIKRGLIEVGAARRQLERQAERLRAGIPRLEEQARRALRSRREDLARGVLLRKQDSLRELSALEEQLRDIHAEEERLSRAEQQLSQRVERFRLHRTVLSARYSAAEAQTRVTESLAGCFDDEQTELTLAVERSEDKVERVSARAAASEAVLAAPHEDALDREVNDLDAALAVDAELEALKRELEQSEPRPREQAPQQPQVEGQPQTREQPHAQETREQTAEQSDQREQTAEQSDQEEPRERSQGGTNHDA